MKKSTLPAESPKSAKKPESLKEIVVWYVYQTTNKAKNVVPYPAADTSSTKNVSIRYPVNHD